MRLRAHFMPDFPSAVGTAKQFRGQGDNDDDNTSFVTIVLEEGRDLSHPDMPVGPLDLFAEVSVHYQSRGRDQRPRFVGGAARNVPGNGPLRSER